MHSKHRSTHKVQGRFRETTPGCRSIYLLIVGKETVVRQHALARQTSDGSIERTLDGRNPEMQRIVVFRDK